MHFVGELALLYSWYTCRGNNFFSHKHCAVYKIYPQSETPQLTLISYLPIGPRVQPPVFLLHNRVVWYTLYDDRIVFRVWDYELNHSISFSTEMDVEGFDYYLEVFIPIFSKFLLMF